MRYVVLASLWVAWCFLHSFMITRSVTGYVQKHFEKIYPYYRIIYNGVALITLIPVLVYSFSLKGTPVFFWKGPFRIVQGLFVVSALFLFAAGARQYDLSQFLGVRRSRERNACHVLTDDCELNTEGILGMVRHPWYTGGILIVWARPLDTVAFLTSTVITGYFLIGSFLEERKLLAEFGEAYRDYQRRVSMFLPCKWIMQKFTQ